MDLIILYSAEKYILKVGWCNMKTYEFEIIETLQKIVSVSANNEREAYNKVFNMYTNGEVTLDAEDFLETEINYIGSDNY